jgi:cyclopropane-fatty-acyl-phospholipid synthase
MMSTQRIPSPSPIEPVVQFGIAPAPYAIESRSGGLRKFGSGPPAFVVRVRDGESWERLIARGAYATATAFVHGAFDVDGDMVAALRWWHASHSGNGHGRLVDMLGRLRLESWFQTKTQARRNIAFHYDRSNRFYEQFLDAHLQYSSAYFTDRTRSLDQAQMAKLDLICRKLDLHAGLRFLDVGCGWGGLPLHAAERYGTIATGCTLSAQQFAFANRRVAARQLRDRVTILNTDYRELAGRFDRIASVGMYEHVGRRRLEEYFRTLSRLLAPDGLLLNHGIARPETVTDDAETIFLRRFVFPGGELPYFAEVVRAAERAGFEVIDVENLRPHYAMTCAAWVRRLQAHRDACLALVDATTYRTWLLYLASAAVNFERGTTELYQTLLARRAPGTPRRLTRAYLCRDDVQFGDAPGRAS